MWSPSAKWNSPQRPPHPRAPANSRTVEEEPKEAAKVASKEEAKEAARVAKSDIRVNIRGVWKYPWNVEINSAQERAGEREKNVNQLAKAAYEESGTDSNTRQSAKRYLDKNKIVYATLAPTFPWSGKIYSPQERENATLAAKAAYDYSGTDSGNRQNIKKISEKVSRQT